MSVAEWYPEQLPQALRTAAGLTDEELAALVPFAGAFADLAAVPNARVVILLEVPRPEHWESDMNSTGPCPSKHFKTIHQVHVARVRVLKSLHVESYH